MCPGCGYCPPRGNCWSRSHCQVLEWGTDCHSECLGGCSGPSPKECTACKNFIHGNKCVSSCPPFTYEFETKRCVTKDECLAMNNTLLRPGKTETKENWFVWDSLCVNSCPRGLERDKQLGCKKCPGRCVLHCKGANVESIQSAQQLRYCTHIEGPLVIQLRSGNQSFIQKELEENLGHIEEIMGYLKIVRSFPLANLNFLMNLRVIHGSKLFSDPMNLSFIMLENQNLQTIWDWDNRPAKRNFTILAGRLFFHYNPSLCLKHIYELGKIAGIEKIKNSEVAKESNGNKFACNIIDLNIKVHFRNSTCITIFIAPPKFRDAENQENYLLRYLAYYIKAPFRNVTADYEINECGSYRWTVDDVINYPEKNYTKGVYHTLTQLEPNTQYAIFVKTYTIDSTGGQSTTLYERTLPSKPTPPMEFHGASFSSDSILLEWEPPQRTNGHITEYIVTGFSRVEESNMLNDMDFCLESFRDTLTNKKPEVTTILPEFKTQIGIEKHDCCSDEEPKKLEHPELICHNKNLKEAKVASSFINLKEEASCEKYFYSLLENNILKTENQPSKRYVDYKKKFVNDLEDVKKKKPLFTIYEIVPGNRTNVTIKNLDHFMLYTFEVKACRQIDPAEEVVTDKDRCSMSSTVTLRTLRKLDADDVSWLTTEVNNRSVQLKWDVPSKPNLMIFAFDLEYRRTDIPNFRPTIDCIKAHDYRSKGSYFLHGLDIGQYSIRVRAISLAGLGNFTEYKLVSIYQFSSKKIILIVVGVAICIIIVAALAASVAYFWKRITMRNEILIASVNPEYLGLPLVDEEWELPRERIQVIRELKRGNFGIVCEGILLPEEKRVAVKKVVETASDRDCVEFLNEAAVMKRFTSAYHIVKLIGIVSKDWPQLVIMEMMDHGDLKTYLRECRNTKPPLPQQMLLMAAQIADGMAYMEVTKHVHRDLAARNCMIREDLVVKIGDFGMARDIYETDYYRKGNKGLLPIRWMAPESLNDGVFSSRSDAWSYGIVLWEMATLASQPYQGMSNEQVMAHVVSGNKLDLPPIYPKPFKTLMLWCWKWKPKFRPSFLQILDELHEHTTKGFREVSYYDSPEGREAREALSSELQHGRLELTANTASFHTANENTALYGPI
nr:insulin receptor-like [Halyomorpha halys]